MLTRAARKAADDTAAFWVEAEDGSGASAPRRSNDQAWQAAKDGSQDRRIGIRRWQMQPDLRLHLHHAHGDFDEPQPQSIELRHPPAGALRHGGSFRHF